MSKVHDGLYALYLRRSRADLEKERIGKFETLKAHEHELTKFARTYGYILDQPYYREIVTGERLEERYEFRKMMEKVQAGEYAGVLVHAIARLGRGDPMQYGWILNIFKATKTKIITPTKIYNPCDDQDFRTLQMEMFISNMELGNIRYRLTAGARYKASIGAFVKGNPAYGYDRVKKDGLWTLEPNGDADTVRLIYQWSADGRSRSSIARELNQSGIRTRSGHIWHAISITRIITNPVYKGMIRYGYNHVEKFITSDFKTKQVHSFNDEYILVPGIHEAIVSDELWDRANGTVSVPVSKDKTVKNPLAGLLFCAKCGASMRRASIKVRSNGKMIYHYKHAPTGLCKMRGAKVSLVFDAFCEALETLAHDYEVTVDRSSESNQSSEAEIIRKQLEREENALEKLLELYYSDAITIEEFKQKRSESKGKAESLQNRLKELEIEPAPPEKIVYMIKDALRLLRDDDIPAQLKNDVLKGFVDRVEFDNRTEHINEQNIRLKIFLK